MASLLAKLVKLKKYKELIAMITAVLAIGGELAVALLGDICSNWFLAISSGTGGA